MNSFQKIQTTRLEEYYQTHNSEGRAVSDYLRNEHMGSSSVYVG